MKLLLGWMPLYLLLLLSSPGVLAASPLPDILPPPPVPVLSLSPLLPLPLPAPHQPGDLARDRLGKMASLLLTTSKVAVAQIGQSASPLPPERAKAVLAILSGLVLDDALYVPKADYEMQDKSRRVILVMGDFDRQVTVSIWRDKPLMTINSEAAHGWVTANYLPLLPEVVKLLHTVDPDDPGLDRALVKAPSPLPSTKDIPVSVLTRIATLKPGMTRVGVLYLFMTEGGVSTTYWNHYVYRSGVPSTPSQPDDRMQVPGGLIKVDVDFAPQDADIVWLGGRGFWLHQNDYESQHKTPNYWGMPNDIILRVSAPYIQNMIVD